MRRGYIALTAVLIISTILTGIILAGNLLSISLGQMSLSEKQAESANNMIDGCTEEALLYLNKNGALPSSVMLPEITCTLVVNSQVGNIYNFTVSGTVNGYDQAVTIEAQRTNTVVINKWIN